MVSDDIAEANLLASGFITEVMLQRDRIRERGKEVTRVV